MTRVHRALADVGETCTIADLRSETCLQPHRREHRIIEIISAGVDPLNITGKSQPGRNEIIVERLDALLVCELQTGNSQTFNQVVAQAIIEIADTPSVGLPARDRTVAGQASQKVPFNRVWIAVRDRGLGEETPTNRGVAGILIEILLHARADSTNSRLWSAHPRPVQPLPVAR